MCSALHTHKQTHTHHWVTTPKNFIETDTETFLWDQNFRDRDFFSRLNIFETDTETFFRDQNFRDRDRYSQKIEKSLDTEKSRDEMSHSGYYPPPPFTHSRNMVNCNHLLMSMFIMFFSLSNCVQYGLRRVQQILATKSYITRFQTKLSRYRRADRPQLQILLSHVESQKPVKTVAARYIQRLLLGSRFPLSVI